MTYAEAFEEAIAELNPDEVERGREWYPKAFAQVCELAGAYRVNYKRACWAAAALSPGVRWASALHTLEVLLAARRDLATSFPRGGYEPPMGYRGVERAWLVLTTDVDPVSVVRGPKVVPFAVCLLGSRNTVVVDRHLTRAATRGAKSQVSNKQRDAIEDAFRLVADRHGLGPAELQAAIWLHNMRPRAVAHAPTEA